MVNVEFAHGIGQKVKVSAIGMSGAVDSMSFDANGKQYRVVYWNNGERYAVWMYEWELEPERGGA